MKSIILTSVFGLLLSIQCVTAQEKVQATIFVDGKKAYNQTEEYVLKDGTIYKTIHYDLPSGKTVVKTTISYDPNSLEMKDFQQEDLRTGMKEKVTKTGNAYKIQYKKNQQASQEEKTLTADGFILSGALFTSYLKKNLDKLLKGETLTFTFPAPSMQRFIDFSAEKVEDKTIDGVTYTCIKLYISTWVLRMLVDPMYFHFEKSGQRRMKIYMGRLTPFNDNGDPQTGKVIFNY